MAWITPTVADLKEIVSGSEYDSITTAVLDDGQTGTSVTEAALIRWTNHCRGYVPREISLGAEGTIPEKLLQVVLVLARRTTFSRLPGMEGLHTPLRDKEVETAEKTLQDCKRGEFRLEEPTVPAPASEQGGAAVPSTTPKRQRFSREAQDGV